MSTYTTWAICKDRFTYNPAPRSFCCAIMSRIRGMAHTLMRTYQLQTSLWLPQPRKQIFAFFAEPKNLEKITPPWLRFEIISPTELAVGRGTRIDYRLRVRGLPIPWQGEITVGEPPIRFTVPQTPGA